MEKLKTSGDLISRSALIENIKRVYCTDCNSYGGVRCRACGTGDALDMLEDAPTVDAVEVVRCKDCTYGEEDFTEFFKYYHCRYEGGVWHKEYHFCSYGERRTMDGGSKDNGC